MFGKFRLHVLLHALPELKKMHYFDRLKQLNLPTLTYRRSRGDMIETYKLLAWKYDQHSTGGSNVTKKCDR